jgi:hypothetical protein
MGSVVISGATSGAVTLAVPAEAGTRTITFPAVTGELWVIPSGTRMSFQQTAAPTGWTKDTTAAINDTAMRLTTGTVGTGGSVAFETAFASQAVAGTNGNTAATTISTSTMPSHNHTPPAVVLWGVTGAPSPTLFSGTATAAHSGSPNAAYWPNTGSTGGGGSHVHGGSTFSGTAIDLNVKFYDFIIAAKD